MSYSGQKNKFLERHGTGHYQYENLFFRYHGSYLHNKKEGYGVLEMGDGSSIEGEFKDGEICGKGLRRFPNGSTYQGEFKDGERHGYGIFYGSNNLETLKGQWMWNRLNGEATCTLRNQDQIKGIYKNHLLHGENISYNFMNGKASYEGSFQNGKYDGEGIFIASRLFDEEISNHVSLPAGTSLPENSILKRSFWKQVYQPIVERYSGSWKNGKKDGFGIWEFKFISRKQFKEGNGEPYVMKVEGQWSQDEPIEKVTNIIAIDPNQTSKWYIETLNNLSDNRSLEEDEKDEEENQSRVIVVPMPKDISIPQYTIKLNSPQLKLLFLLTTKVVTTQEVVQQAPPIKGKAKVEEPIQPTFEEIVKFKQCNMELGRLIKTNLYKIPESFVKKKPAKGETLEEISSHKLPSEREMLDLVVGIPASFQILPQGDESSIPGIYTEVTFNFSKLQPGYYALQFKSAWMSIGSSHIQDYIIYIQVVK